MKSEGSFALENAAWPALAVDPTGTIRAANKVAVSFFGPVVDGDSTLLSAIWSKENEPSANVFLTNWERTRTPVTPLKLLVRGGGTRVCPAHICLADRDGQRLFVFQFLGETAGHPAPAAPAASGAAPPAGTVAIPGAEPRAPLLDAGVAHRQKLECALQMARSVALDFNNALTIILGHTSLMLRKLEAASPWRKSLLEIEKAAGKAAEIANDLATFSRQEKDTRGQTAGNLNSLLRRVVEMFQKQADNRVVWTLHLERNLFGTSCDEAKMQQAIARVLENAVQALGADGRVSVESRNLEVDQPLKDRNVDLAPGLYVCVEITDNGIGIAPDVLPRVFEPFFTTKPDHRGLGLAWAYGIVTNHGGLIALQSVPGQGTTARIYLPATRRVVRDSDIREEELTGYQTILVVDDEDLLLTLAETVLSDYGYRVLTANSGQKALEHIAVAERPIDLLVTDLVMPQMSGRELIEQVRHFSPATRIVFSSGYVRPPGAEEEENFLRKPFTAQELLLKVREALS